MIKLSTLLTKERLNQLAWGRSFERGERYFKDGAVQSLRVAQDEITAKVTGTRAYRVRLWSENGAVGYDCSCPVGGDGLFCKHCVAVGLAQLDDCGTPGEAAAGDIGEAALRSYLLGLEKEDLAETIIEQTRDDDRLRRKLMIQAAHSKGSKPDLSFWRGAIDDALRNGGYIDYQDMYDYGSGIDDVIDGFDALLASGHGEAIVELTEYGLGSVEESIQYVDDSDGWMGGFANRLQELHLAACLEARPDPVVLAERLFEAEMESEYGVFQRAAETYSEVLGADGLNAYRKLAEADWAKITPIGPGDKESSIGVNRYSITSIMESLAMATGDTGQLIAVKTKNLSLQHHFLDIAKIYEKAGQPDLALEWAEKGHSSFPDEPLDDRLREFIANAYHDRGRHGDAMALAWTAFSKHPYFEKFKVLESHALRAAQWPAWRDKALSLIRALIWEEAGDTKAPSPRRQIWHEPVRYDGSVLVRIFLSENDIDAAWREAKEHGCSEEFWLELAAGREATHPAESIQIYRDHITGLLCDTGNRLYEESVEYLEKIRRLISASGEISEFDVLVGTIRSSQKRKRNLMKMLDAKGW